MKRYLIMILVILTFTQCEEFTNSAEKSKVTYLPKIEMIGPSSEQLECDATGWTDPGVDASEGGEPIEVETVTHGSYYGSSTVNGPDVYDISYSAVNVDGIPGSAFRSVFWPECNGNLTTSIAGMYKANVVRNGVVSAQYQGLGPIFIVDLGGGQYQLSDAIGGYYDFGRGYGYHYAALGMVVTANNIPGNDFTYGDPVPVGDFGGELEMTAFSVNAANKTIQFTTDWDAGFTFVVTLTQYEP